MIGQPYLETALPAKFLQYGVASAVARYRKYMTVLGQSLILLLSLIHIFSAGPFSHPAVSLSPLQLGSLDSGSI